MKKLILSAILATASAVPSQLSITRVAPVPPDVAAANKTLTTYLAPSANDKLQQLVTLIASQIDPNLPKEAVVQLVQPLLTTQFPGLTPDSPDVNTIMFLVMSQTATAQEPELSAITAEVASMSQQKDELRKRMASTKAKGAAAAAPLSISLAAAVPPAMIKTPDPLPANAPIEAMAKRISDLGDMAQGNALRFQLLSARRAKALDIAADALKRMPSALTAQVVQNLK